MAASSQERFSSILDVNKSILDANNHLLRSKIQSKSVKSLWLIDKLFGRHHWCNKWVVALCTVDMMMLNHIADQKESYVHYLCLVKLGIEQFDDPMESIGLYAELIRTTSKHKLLKSLYPTHTDGVRKVLPKLGEKALSRKSYKRLITLLKEDNTRSLLLKSQEISPSTLKIIEKLPSELRGCRVINTLDSKEKVSGFLYIIDSVQIVNHDKNQSEIVTSLQKVHNFAGLEQWFVRWTKDIHFPSPPWSGSKLIQPITTCKELERQSLRFNNCIFDYLEPIHMEQNYIYIYKDKHESAAILLERDPYQKWIIDQIKGIGNKPISKKCRKYVVDEFLSQGIKDRYGEWNDVSEIFCSCIAYDWD